MRLKILRKNANKTQQNIADYLNMTAPGYNCYENEKREPNIETLCKLADYYKVSLDYLVGRNFVNEVGYLTDQQKQAVNLLKNLNELNLINAIGYISGLLANQN